MRKIALLISFIFALSSCVVKQSNESCEAQDKSKYEIILDSAAASKLTDDTIFLDFRFGMTEKELSRHMKSMVRKGKVYTDYLDRYTYKLKWRGKLNYELRFKPEYYQGKLVRMTFPIESGLGGSGSHVLVFDMFTEANPDYKWTIDKDFLGNPVYVAHKNNIVVKFEGLAGSQMVYEDARYLRDYKLDKQRNDSIERAKSLEDF